jgi:hypothetical protein
LAYENNGIAEQFAARERKKAAPQLSGVIPLNWGVMKSWGRPLVLQF